jgi:head-tail adaptor
VSLERFLTHRVSVLRRVAVLDDDEVTVDEYNQPVIAESAIATGVAVSIQPRSAKELALLSQAGPVVSDYRIYLRPRDLTTADVIVHDSGSCPMRTDLPDARFEVTAVPDAAGAGRHIEVAARHVGSPTRAYAVPVGEGS